MQSFPGLIVERAGHCAQAKAACGRERAAKASQRAPGDPARSLLK